MTDRPIKRSGFSQMKSLQQYIAQRHCTSKTKRTKIDYSRPRPNWVTTARHTYLQPIQLSTSSFNLSLHNTLADLMNKQVQQLSRPQQLSWDLNFVSVRETVDSLRLRLCFKQRQLDVAHNFLKLTNDNQEKAKVQLLVDVRSYPRKSSRN